MSCYGVEKPSKPSGLLSEDQMVAVLVDLSLVASAKGVNKSQLEKKGIVPEAYIYKKNNVDSLQFVNSNKYYTGDLEAYKRIYAKVKSRLLVLKKKYNVKK